MSAATFLGTPLSKYEIDDIETDLVNKRAKNFEKSKELQYRQNRERIKRNQIITHYTVDTAEGFVPANFKSSKTNRASYTQQEVSTFTDLEDAEITTKNTLKAIKIDRVGLRRNVAAILTALGFMGKKRFIGPINIHAPQTRISSSLEGVGFTFDVDKCVEKLHFVNAENDDYGSQGRHHHIPAGKEQKGHQAENLKESGDHRHRTLNLEEEEGTKETATLARHVPDRQFDLSEIQFYYKHLYNLIVKPMEVKEDLVEIIEKGIEFATEGVAKEKVVETGRKVELYTFDDELLHRFRIKTKRTKDDSGSNGSREMDDGAAPTAKLPSELFARIFGK
ncbi:G patch domain-containing protein [Babesia ovata]|uniref:G patch domain-containing protein n=1 Tax=Babesia ovata TaxID=189622 RepID=A0A2H6KIC3_9APIC|nr:G patch domain-containing protein [Babesia ovata]GBE62736.1 G patch domain-containing protein [Babesia ovata]